MNLSISVRDNIYQKIEDEIKRRRIKNRSAFIEELIAIGLEKYKRGD